MYFCFIEKLGVVFILIHKLLFDLWLITPRHYKMPLLLLVLEPWVKICSSLSFSVRDRLVAALKEQSALTSNEPKAGPSSTDMGSDLITSLNQLSASIQLPDQLKDIIGKLTSPSSGLSVLTSSASAGGMIFCNWIIIRILHPANFVKSSDFWAKYKDYGKIMGILRHVWLLTLVC